MNEQTTDETGEIPVKEMVRQWLVEHGYDGLCIGDDGWDCGCAVDDLAPCGDSSPFHCVAAIRKPDGLFYPAGSDDDTPGSKPWRDTTSNLRREKTDGQATADMNAEDMARAIKKQIDTLAHTYWYLSEFAGHASVTIGENVFSSAEDVVEYCKKLPVGMAIRDGWYCPGCGRPTKEPNEYRIVLVEDNQEGVRITGKLFKDGENHYRPRPISVRVEARNGCGPWTEVKDIGSPMGLWWFVSLFEYEDNSGGDDIDEKQR
ncbi:MAG: hypothetical protein PHZ19_10535 [Candidatus Thermoplasmatota archaeon]|nr:hypothetical protein [Candidatus Thermoplasmatota archaeon]